MILRFDFHNHSCLSPCASLENSPSEMAARAVQKHLDILALTDHNSSLNCPAFAIAAARAGLIPLFGLEINPFEEAHLLAIFPDPLSALAFSDWALEYLPPLELDSERFGDQVVVDPAEEILSMPSAWYGNALKESFSFFARRAAEAGALVIPAHVDRPQFSVYSQLGFLPDGPYDAVEAMGPNPDSTLTGKFCVISGSDAHVPEHVGRRPSTVELGDEIFEKKLRAGLAAMVSAWEHFQSEPDGANGAPSENYGAEAEARIEQDAAVSDASRSSEIPGMAPLTDFFRRFYPIGEARSFFEELRRAFAAGRAWSVYRRPREE